MKKKFQFSWPDTRGVVLTKEFIEKEVKDHYPEAEFERWEVKDGVVNWIGSLECAEADDGASRIEVEEDRAWWWQYALWVASVMGIGYALAYWIHG